MNGTFANSRWLWLLQGILGVSLAMYTCIDHHADTHPRPTAGCAWWLDGFILMLLGGYLTLKGYRLLPKYARDEKPDWRLPFFRILGPMFLAGFVMLLVDNLPRHLR